MRCSYAGAAMFATVVHAPSRMTIRRSRGRRVMIWALGTAAAAGALATNRAMAQTLAVGGQHVCVITTTGGVKVGARNALVSERSEYLWSKPPTISVFGCTWILTRSILFSGDPSPPSWLLSLISISELRGQDRQDQATGGASPTIDAD